MGRLPDDSNDDHIAPQRLDEDFILLKRLLEVTTNPRIVHVTLLVMEKFISSDILVGDGPGLPPVSDSETVSSGDVSVSREGTPPLPSNKILMDDIVYTVSDCVRRNSHDENIQLAAIKCIVCAVLSPNRLVHGSSLMTCIRMCYSINKDSKSANAQSAATVALTQMLNSVIVSLETLEDPSLASERSQAVLADWVDSYAHQLINKTVLLNEPPADEGKYGWCIVCDSAANYHCMQTRDPICSWNCKKKNLERVSLVSGGTLPPKPDRHPSIEYQDVLSVFRSLCKLSAGVGATSGNGGPFSTAIPDVRIVKAKRLSLELISAMLESSGPHLKTDPVFIEMIQHVLIVSLLSNSVSPVPKIFSIALDIFAQLLRDFRKPLIREIGIFIDKVFLYILESENASFAHKSKVLEIFNSLCFDAKSAIELFQFFDCAIGERNVFELSVNCLAMIAMGKFAGTMTFPGPLDAAAAASPPTANLTFSQQQELKKMALDSLISLVESTFSWIEKDHQVSVVQTAPPVVEEFDDQLDVSRTTTPPPGIAKQRKDQKNQLETALELFKHKPSKGIDLLIEHGFIADRFPVTIARALKNLSQLDKTAIGDFIGELKEENLKIFYAFVDLFDFSGMELDVALRHFLSAFRLPGEAQKIDRIMEKFAEKFFTNNPTKFPNADCAYVLSFAVIMLNTDLHSSQVKRKMTIEEFVKLGKGINTEIEISELELARLYRNIQAEEITLIDPTSFATTPQPMVIDPTADPIGAQRRRFEMFIRETEKMVETTRSVLTSNNASKKQAFAGTIKVQRKSAANVPEPQLGDIPPLMLAVAWPTLHALKASLCDSQSERIFHTWSNFVKICGHFPDEDLDSIKSEFIKQLSVFAQSISLKDQVIDPLKIDAIHTLIDLVISQPRLVSNWFDIFSLFSIIDRWNYLSFRLKSVDPVIPAPPPPSLLNSMVGGARKWWYNNRSTGLSGDEISDLSPLEKENIEFLVSATTTASDKIDSLFYQSTSLSPVSVLNLVRSLVDVSKMFEITSVSHRLFCLQKLVEVADFNMHRIRIVWSKIWTEIHPFLVFIASSSSAASFAIDALRQLALKYLAKSELSNYHFQAEFLRPFLIIMTNPATTLGSRILVMDIVCSLAQTVPDNIKSGWVSLFSISQLAGSSTHSPDLVLSAFEFVKIIDANDQIKTDYFREFFDLVSILKDTDSAWPIIEENIFSLTNPRGALNGRLTDLNSGGIWLTVFQTLAKLLSDSRLREKSKILLFKHLLTNETNLNNETIRIFIRGVLVPWFDDQVHSDDFREQIISEITLAFSTVCVDNFSTQFHSFIPEMFSVYQILISTVHSDKLFQVAIESIRSVFSCENINFLARNHFNEYIVFSECMSRIIDSTIPSVLLDYSGGKHVDLARLPFDPKEVMNTCVAHLSVLGVVLDLVETIEKKSDDDSGLLVIAKSVEKSYNFAVRFNAETALRDRLKKLGFMKDLRQLPKLVKQELIGLNILLRVYSKDGAKLKSVIVSLVDEYLEKEKLLHSVSVQVQDHVHEEIEGSISGFNNLISGQIIEKIFAHMEEDEFLRNKEWIFDLMIKLIHSNDLGVRRAVSDCLAKRFKPKA